MRASARAGVRVRAQYSCKGMPAGDVAAAMPIDCASDGLFGASVESLTTLQLLTIVIL